MRYIFNPEHDLCLANGSPTFVPPESALKFGHDCRNIMENVLGQSGDGEAIVPWGWDNVLKYNLLKAGTPEELLPSDEALEQIRSLSHRRTAIKAGKYIRERLKDSGPEDSAATDSGLAGFLVKDTPEEIDRPDMVNDFLEKHPNAVFKAPWSGSGKGLRWVRRNEFSHSDRGWCRNIIAKQGSVIAEQREDVVCDFAMLFQSTATGIIFEGYSLFDTDNGAYRSNILASDRYILAHLSRFIPENVLTAVRRQLTTFLKENFSGRYEGYLGVDMFICRANTETDSVHGTDTFGKDNNPGRFIQTEDSQGKYLLNPCVEINARMTMGLLARKYFDRHMQQETIPGYPGAYNSAECCMEEAVSDNDKASTDGRYRFSVVYAPDHATLRAQLAQAVRVLTEATESARYGIAVFNGQPPHAMSYAPLPEVQ